jgi:beta-galactosidase
MAILGNAGAIRWCAFDYNTHRDFVSGDRILLSWRGGHVQKPQLRRYSLRQPRSPSEGIVLEPASRFTKANAAGHYAAGGCLHQLRCRGSLSFRSAGRTFYPDRNTYPHLLHPPVPIDDLIGNRLDSQGFHPADKNDSSASPPRP